VSLVLHVGCALCLLKLIYDLMRATSTAGRTGSDFEAQRKALVYASIGAAAFAIHPVAVYAAVTWSSARSY